MPERASTVRPFLPHDGCCPACREAIEWCERKLLLVVGDGQLGGELGALKESRARSGERLGTVEQDVGVLKDKRAQSEGAKKEREKFRDTGARWLAAAGAPGTGYALWELIHRMMGG